jgi:hypothetical protein
MPHLFEELTGEPFDVEHDYLAHVDRATTACASRLARPLLAPGAGTNLLRSTGFVDGAGGHVAVLVAWTLLGLAALAMRARLRRARGAVAAWACAFLGWSAAGERLCWVGRRGARRR